MAKGKKFEEWEKHFGLISKVYDPEKHKDTMTEDEFKEATMSNLDDVVGVNHDDRIKFLKDNGYEVTRENMANPDLSAKQPSEG